MFRVPGTRQRHPVSFPSNPTFMFVLPVEPNLHVCPSRRTHFEIRRGGGVGGGVRGCAHGQGGGGRVEVGSLWFVVTRVGKEEREDRHSRRNTERFDTKAKSSPALAEIHQGWLDTKRQTYGVGGCEGWALVTSLPRGRTGWCAGTRKGGGRRGASGTEGVGGGER